jgi:hypothetical protein
MRGLALVLGGAAVMGVVSVAVSGCKTMSPAEELAKIPKAAAGDSALGRCPGNEVFSQGQLSDVVEQPSHPAERVPNGVVPIAIDSKYRLVAIGSDQDLTSAIHRTAYVTAVSIVDTAGNVVPGTVVITSSDGFDLSRAVCTAMPHMAFIPARDDGKKVRALYREEFEMYRTLDPNGNRVVWFYPDWNSNTINTQGYWIAH